jgi:hypothetical protein
MIRVRRRRRFALLGLTTPEFDLEFDNGHAYILPELHAQPNAFYSKQQNGKDHRARKQKKNVRGDVAFVCKLNNPTRPNAHVYEI